MDDIRGLVCSCRTFNRSCLDASRIDYSAYLEAIRSILRRFQHKTNEEHAHYLAKVNAIIATKAVYATIPEIREEENRHLSHLKEIYTSKTILLSKVWFLNRLSIECAKIGEFRWAERTYQKVYSIGKLTSTLKTAFWETICSTLIHEGDLPSYFCALGRLKKDPGYFHRTLSERWSRMDISDTLAAEVRFVEENDPLFFAKCMEHLSLLNEAKAAELSRFRSSPAPTKN